MRDQRAGTATFIPLNSISVPPLNDRFRNYTRGSRLAFDIIGCDKKFESVIQYACANSLVCDNVNIAKDICYNKNEEVKGNNYSFFWHKEEIIDFFVNETNLDYYYY